MQRHTPYARSYEYEVVRHYPLTVKSGEYTWYAQRIRENMSLPTRGGFAVRFLKGMNGEAQHFIRYFRDKKGD